MKSNKHPTEKLGRKPKTSKKLSFDSIKNAPQNLGRYIGGLGRNTRLALVLVLVLVVVGGLVGLLGGSDAAEESFASESVEEITNDNNIKAVLQLVEGSVETKNQDGDWKEIEADHELVEGDDIRTIGATSRTAIEFENGSVIRIDANSEVLLETANTDRIVIKQTNGYSYSRVSPSNTTSYVVKSTDAQYEASGTAFLVITNGDEQAVEVYENTVIETSINQKVDQGKKLIVASSVAPASNGTIESIDIEIVKQNSFMSWNRALDLENEVFKQSLGFLSDIESPTITISSPADNATILLEPNADKGTVEFSGSAEPNSSLNIVSKSSSDQSPLQVTTDAAGAFKSPVIEAPLGDSIFEFTARDKTGNKTVRTMRLTFQRKSAPVVSGGILLSVAENGDEIKASWSYSGSFKPTDGVKIVYSESSSPKFGSDDSVYSENGNNATIKLSKLSDDTTYYFRACSYDKKKNSCSDYSKEVTFKTAD